MRARECERGREKGRAWERESRNIEKEIKGGVGCAWLIAIVWKGKNKKSAQNKRDRNASLLRWEQEKDENIQEIKRRKKNERRLLSDTRQSLYENKLTSASTTLLRAPDILFRSYFLRVPWFSFFRLYLYDRNIFYVVTKNLHILNIDFNRRVFLRRLRAHEETRGYTRTQKGHLYRVYVYTYHGTYEIKYIQ